MTIGNHLVEKKDLNKRKEKDLKNESRLLTKLSPSLGSINQVISSEYQEWFLERDHLSLL